jgi:SAM-dependent methyltransferase
MWGDNYGYRSGVNETMRAELKDITTQIEKIVRFQNDEVVLDIGCNDGTLLSSYTVPSKKVGFDPSVNMAKYAKEAGHEVVYDYFSKEKYKYPMARAITAIAMFYDLEDPNKFLEDVKACLHPWGVFVIQQNYLVGMLEQLAFDNICHEHLEYYSLTSLIPLLESHGLELIDATTNNINGGSLRTYIRHKGATVYSAWGQDRINKLLRKEKDMGLDNHKTYQSFADKVKTQGKQLREFVDTHKNIYVYGASTRGGTLLQFCGIGKKQIVAAADRNPDKWGKIMQSTGIPIVSEEEARAKADYFLVLPWFFRGEFVERESEFLKSGKHLVFPLPKFEIV